MWRCRRRSRGTWLVRPPSQRSCLVHCFLRLWSHCVGRPDAPRTSHCLELCGDPQFRPGTSRALGSRVTASGERLCRDGVRRPSGGPRIPTAGGSSGCSLLSGADARCGHPAQALAGGQTGCAGRTPAERILEATTTLCIQSGERPLSLTSGGAARTPESAFLPP